MYRVGGRSVGGLVIEIVNDSVGSLEENRIEPRPLRHLDIDRTITDEEEILRVESLIAAPQSQIMDVDTG